MIEELTNRLVKLIRGALLPATLPQAELRFYGGWENKTELTGAWLTQIIHTVRFSRRVCFCVSLKLSELFSGTSRSAFLLFGCLRSCHEALSALEIPNDLLQVIQDLLLDLRVHCLMVTLMHTAEGEKGFTEQEASFRMNGKDFLDFFCSCCSHMYIKAGYFLLETGLTAGNIRLRA